MTHTPQVDTITTHIDDAGPAINGPIIVLSGPDRNASSADLARMLLTVKHGEGAWDQPMQTFGLLHSSRPDNALCEAVCTQLHSNGADTDAWIAVPLQRPNLPERQHYADHLLGLQLRGWDGAAHLNEAWIVNADTPVPHGLRVADTAGAQEARQVTAVKTGTGATEAATATYRRVDTTADEPWIDTHASGPTSRLLRIAVNGPEPARWALSTLCEQIHTGYGPESQRYTWAYTADDNWYQHGIDEFATIGRDSQDASAVGHWNTYIPTLDSPTNQPWELSPDTLNWAGGLEAITGWNDPEDKQTRTAVAVTVAWRTHTLHNDTGAMGHQLVHSLARLCQSIEASPDFYPLNTLLADITAGGPDTGLDPDALAAVNAAAEANPRLGLQWGLASADPQMRRTTLDAIITLLSPDDLPAALADVTGVTGPVLDAVLTAVGTIGAACTYTPGDDLVGLPEPVARLVAVLTDSPI